jgi:thiol-disulfide isomerase/thioredoxin
MRNFAFALVLAGFAWSCDYIDEPFRDPGGGNSTEANGDTVLQSERAVLVEDFTGHQCKNCPKASKVLQQLDSLYGSARVIGLAIHAGPAIYTAVSADYPTDFTTDDGDDLASFFIFPGLPSGMVNRMDYPNTHKAYSSWAALTATELALAPEVLFNAYSGFDSTSGVATVRLDVRAQSSYSNAIGLAVYLKESGIVSPQLMPDQTRDTSYVHYNVFRSAPWGPFGQEVWSAGASAAGAVKNYEASKTLDPSWNPSQMHWVALAYDKSTYRVLQALQISVK